MTEGHSAAERSVKDFRNVPTATKWLLTSVGSKDQPAIRSVLMVASTSTQRKGTGFALKSGRVITNEHVVTGSRPEDLVLIDAAGARHSVEALVADADSDLAAISVSSGLEGGFRIQEEEPAVGERVHTWGYPLAYNGPSPLLAVGYLAGFNAEQRTTTSREVKHFVVNGAFNPGNSGGPLIGHIEDAVVGVVVSKHAPISQFHLSALEALANQKSGFVYTATDEAGNSHQFSEGQIVGDLLRYFREITQVVIGEAIVASELRTFLSEHDLPWDAA